MSFFYRPDDGVAADFIPFYWEGDYHLFYLKDYRDVPGRGEGTPWFHLVTRDMVHFEDWGEALARGPAGTQDVWVFTGSAIERDGTHWIYYTGHNSNFKGSGKPVQGVMRASSPDLRTWTKDPDFCFYAPAEMGYEPDDWRDPFVFWSEEANEYWMLLAARTTTGPDRHRGCVALAASADMVEWEVREPFWAPDLYYTHECPDLFRIGDWWYLLYSTFSESTVTHYRMSRSLDGPWLAPADDVLDARAFYAAKTAGDGRDRYLFGWLATREGETDEGRWQWGGNLVVHQIAQQPDGTLVAQPPKTVLDAFGQDERLSPSPVLGEWSVEGDAFALSSIGRFSGLTLGRMPETCRVSLELSYKAGTGSCGVLLRADPDLESYYQVRVEPANRRLVVDRWPRPGDQPFMLERRLHTEPGQPIALDILVDGSCLVVYAQALVERIALSCRMYDHPSGELGLFVAEGGVRFEKVGIAGVGRR